MCPNREEMAHATVAPSIESLLKLAPEDPESWVLGFESQSESHCAPCGARGGCRMHRAGERRNRHRQRALGPPAASLGPAARQAVRARQLRRAHRHAGRKPIVRPREGRVYRRGRAQPGRVPRGGRRHRVPRRSRRDAARAAAEAAARAAAARSDAGRLLDAGASSTCKSWPPRTAIWNWKSPKAGSARTCTTG